MASDDDSDDVLECRVGTSVTKLNWDGNAFEVRFDGFEGLHRARKSNDNFSTRPISHVMDTGGVCVSILVAKQPQTMEMLPSLSATQATCLKFWEIGALRLRSRSGPKIQRGKGQQCTR